MNPRFPFPLLVVGLLVALTGIAVGQSRGRLLISSPAPDVSGTNTGDQTKTCAAGDFISTLAAGTTSTCSTPAGASPAAYTGTAPIVVTGGGSDGGTIAITAAGAGVSGSLTNSGGAGAYDAGILTNFYGNFYATTTLDIVSSTDDATASTTVGAVTIRSATNLTDGDLLLNIENSAGTNVCTVTEQGAVVADALTLNNAGANAFTLNGTVPQIRGNAGNAMAWYSNTIDAVASPTLAAITLLASTALTAGDLVLSVQDNVNAQLFTVNNLGQVTPGAISGNVGVSLTSGAKACWAGTASCWSIVGGVLTWDASNNVQFGNSTVNATSTTGFTNGALSMGSTSIKLNSQAVTFASELPTLTGWGGTGAAIVGSGSSFRVDVGTGAPGSTGTITFARTATTGYTCLCVDETATPLTTTKMSANTTTTCVLTNYTVATGATANWTASDKIHCIATGY